MAKKKKTIERLFNTTTDFFKKKYKKILKIFLLCIFLFLEISLLLSTIPYITDLVKIKGSEIWPAAFNPIARFVANIDWENRIIEFDASISKTYKDEVEKYIWRIDDGTGLVGEKKLAHQFKYPGYYNVRLSIIDMNGQSDVASCTILFPADEIEKKVEIENIQEGNENNKETKVVYKWFPKGTFFNYSKLAHYVDVTNSANLLSNYVNTDCGLSSRGYNVSGVYSNVTERNSMLRKSTAYIVINSSGLVLLFGIFILVNKKLKNIDD
ncbi:hypothetical protein GF362_02975 [Candidatus Dojkabacteria bacterium]|nr:hypothetical protein [Candidatus Dojkabacteria bacterium]